MSEQPDQPILNLQECLALERTVLANERTFLSYARTAVIVFITGVTVFKLFPDLKNWQDFVYGYFRFFLITDFKNEYYKGGESILKFNCFISLAPFIIGKIAVAFGIYEMIQSFRKFKA
jgi:uncharacterized membrane protein YidH (DUF202 family)